ncbi:hypothetical protein C2E20_8930 [Micractinium conductrix]|uniref:Uncharacterized protein n=1 Tax=Micractinium conductrix TaxID=554055 RepID=A0A2P6UZX4_9CHLO|nr:hypothetical protein C2E20_8930 [Micractinium conductrix]|eukprot:PSC67390.1 hypothetical protein C2E20_8930 [Micractinium conductrix]
MAALSGHRRLVLGIVASTLLTVFVLPWGAMALSGAWRAGLTYFLPVMVQTVLNVTVEGRMQRANPPKPLAVYSSTAGNTIVRFSYALAALWDMSLAAAVHGARVHPALVFTAAAQAGVAVFAATSVTAAAIWLLPVQPGTAEARP